MKKFIVIVGVALVALGLSAGAALADNGPHGGYTATTDACAGCHRAHTAIGPNLLVATSTQELCNSCHGSTATGADTNVVDGVYVERDGNPETPAQGVGGAGLLAGGFVNAKMDTNVDGTAASTGSTSSHISNGSTGTVWGYGPVSATTDTGLAGVAMDCASCHNPHGNAGSGKTATYRILRAVPKATGVTAAGVSVADEATKMYTVTAASYMRQTYANGTNVSDWCAQCHTRYMAPDDSGKTASGDAVFKFRHRTDVSYVNCTTCHVAHGSSAAMSGYADMIGTQPGVTKATDSALLRLDNRGVCQDCHQK